MCSLYEVIKALCGIIIIYRRFLKKQIKQVNAAEATVESSPILSIILLVLASFLEATTFPASAVPRFDSFGGDDLWLVPCKKY